jgi:hypothetical protein
MFNSLLTSFLVDDFVGLIIIHPDGFHIYIKGGGNNTYQ